MLENLNAAISFSNLEKVEKGIDKLYKRLYITERMKKFIV